MQLESLPVELKYWPIKRYKNMYAKSLDDIEQFWGREARKLDWFRTWDKVLAWDSPFAKWFPSGLLNASYLCVDRHIQTLRRNKVAIACEYTKKERFIRETSLPTKTHKIYIE